MVFAHPFVMNVLLRSIESCLSELSVNFALEVNDSYTDRVVHAAQDDMLPKDDDELRLLTQALYVGCNVRKFFRLRRQLKFPKCPHSKSYCRKLSNTF